MYFTHLPQVARWIRRTHDTFAGLPALDCMRVLSDLNHRINTSPVVGATYRAETAAEYGQLKTLLYIGRDDRGAWELREQIDRGQD